MNLHPMPGVPRATTRRIGLLGGSFNPAHAGHRHISLEALKRLGLDEVWWLVSPQNPLKSGDGMEPLPTRVARARQVARHPRIRVGAPELVLGTRYTLDTVRALKRVYRDAKFVWLMGADILPQLVDWAGWRNLFEAIPIAAFARPGWGHAALSSTAPRTFGRFRLGAHEARRLATCEPPAWCFIPSRLDEHSATAIRAGRPRRTRSKGKTIPAQTRTLPDRSKVSDALLELVRQSLDDNKAEDIVVIDLKGKSAFADYMVIASGRSTRQVVAIAENLADKLKQSGHGYVPVEGKQTGDWVLVDAGDVIVHVFHPEARAFYGLEKMWALEDEAAAKPVKKAAVRKTAVKKAAAKPAARRKRAS
ncbi:MAG: nicotinate-nucleotide adenylyltransferase [Reyranella sp.]|uniref:nicotinate-nucleotide adenylyltransferase n=1 Tax=Reyranella sp. TaxID=1929291 RepID=UPI0012210C1F|nr:nicotinate-nucleotide adenylyltransferase [Reyranella sp.]TAJ95320.1 MAG: nicotinate-nucleotide adenylyltransferase [Reyranella sp.]